MKNRGKEFILDVLYLGYISQKQQDFSKYLKRNQITIDYNKIK